MVSTELQTKLTQPPHRQECCSLLPASQYASQAELLKALCVGV